MARQRHCRRLARNGKPGASLLTPSSNQLPRPARKAGFSTFESRSGRETDCLLEGDGFEPSVPRKKTNSFWLPAFGPAIRLPQQKPALSCRYRWFESISLQRGVRCELDTAVRRSTSGAFGTPRSVWTGRVPWGGITTPSTAVRVRLTGSVSLLVALSREKKAQEEGRHRCLNYTTVLWLTFNGDNPAQGK